ncbi:hypothetical protein BST81_25720 [Leptolyngbya sp. 'hensonii']|uniref:hypothetical protein n=1 Tax=Leptolyngbya sp. 'hensonii' TaxID=1922337 RepID=UPI0009669F01|nr:hypothetical protein [Leptolyngbya sp. 'hensonii']OLP15550.1 hypothetical protein BST81_25720 [Leptolyngbya sp. 'hensonii']
MALSFKHQSSLAIDSLDRYIRSQTDIAQPTDQEIEARFLTIVLSKKVTEEALENYLLSQQPLQPFPGRSNQADQRILKFINSLREQYNTLSTIYEDLDRGYLFAQDAVAKSREPLQKLTAQMAYFSLCVEAYPPLLTAQRAEFVAGVLQLRQKFMATSNEVERETIKNNLKQQLMLLRQIQEQERAIQRDTIEQTTKAAALGMDLLKQIDQFKRTNSLEDLGFLISKSFNILTTLTGADTKKLQQKSSEILTVIQTDPDFRRVAETALQGTQPPVIPDSTVNLPEQCIGF